MQKYIIIRTLGAGAFGQVFLAQNKQTKQLVAIKQMKQKYTTWNQCLQLRQVKSLLKLKNPNIITLKQVLHIDLKLSLVFQYIQTNLYDQIIKNHFKQKTHQSIIKNIIKKLAQGLSYMHKAGFFHRDLKPENILYNPKSKNIKICDFGLARQVRSAPPYTQYVSTRWYRAPQLILKMSSYNSPVDIFALGCIMVELLTGKPLFPGLSQMDQLLKVFKILGTPNQIDWPQMYKHVKARNINIPELIGQGIQKYVSIQDPLGLDLLKNMLQICPKNRITAQGILKHPYFQDGETGLIQNDYQLKKFRRRGLKVKTNNDLQQQRSNIRLLQTELGEQPQLFRQQSSIKQIKQNKDIQTKENEYLNDLSIKINNQNKNSEQNQKSMEISAIIREIQAKQLKKKNGLKKQCIAKENKEELVHESKDPSSTNRVIQSKKYFDQYFPTYKNPQKQLKQLKQVKQFRGRKLYPSKQGQKRQALSVSPNNECKSLNFLKYKFIPKQQQQQQLLPLIISPSQGNLKKGTILPLLTPRK